MFYEGIFEVAEVDPQGKKFDRVSRLLCKSDNDETEITLDINSQIYKLGVGQKITIALATTLNLDSSPMDDAFNPAMLDDTKKTHLDSFEYVMNGKIFRQQPTNNGTIIEVYASFGGLLMCAKGNPGTLSIPSSDTKIFLLIRKTLE